MTSQVIGRIDEFYDWQDWNVYYERLEQFFAVNDIPEEKRVGIFITVIGSYSYKILRDLCNPVLPKDKTFEELCDLMRRNCCPQVSIFRERIKFYTAKQELHECMITWYRRVKTLSVDCKFGANLESVLTDRFITGLRSGPILDRLCEEKETITLKEALEIALSKEAALADDRREKVRLTREESSEVGTEQERGEEQYEMCNQKEGAENEEEDRDSGHGTVLECDLTKVPQPANDEEDIIHRLQICPPKPAHCEFERPMCAKPAQPPQPETPQHVNDEDQEHAQVSAAPPALGGAPCNEMPLMRRCKAAVPEMQVHQELLPAPKASLMPQVGDVTFGAPMMAAAAASGAALIESAALMAAPAAAPKKTRKRGCRGGAKRNRNA